MAGSLRNLLFPDPPRDFAGRRALKIVLRSVHVLCMALFLGAYVFGAGEDARTTWWIAAAASGVAVLALDLHETFAFLYQVRGQFLTAKVILLALLPWLGAAQVPVLVALVIASVISSHAPGKFRYFLVLGRGRLAAGKKKG